MSASADQARAALRIGNASGFYGDRFAAMREMLAGGDLDVLTGDYLAELTMLILGRDRLRDPGLGYARTFLRQLEDCLGPALDRGVAIVSNSGGLNPAGLATAVGELAGRLGLAPRIGYVAGDDLLPRAAELGLAAPGGGQPVAANAYLGGWGIAECLRAGANVVVTGRVTDASLTVGPAAAHFGWARDDFDALAGATAAGHVLECGAQATGGNYSFFTEIADLRHPGFPLAVIHPDGSSVITKHPGTGGAVTVGTVTAQLLYEVAGPRYAGPDVTLCLDSVRLTQDGPDRVRITGVRGEPPPPTLKVSLNEMGGYRNQVEFVLTGLDIEAKARLVRQQLAGVLPEGAQWTLARTDHPDAATEEEASATLRCVVRGSDAKAVGRAFSGAAVELALASYPGFHATAPPGDAQPYGVFKAAYVDRAQVLHTAVLPGGRPVPVADPPTGPSAPAPLRTRLPEPADPRTVSSEPADPAAIPAWQPGGPTRRVPLGLVAGARSGDKGGDANVGVWARHEAAWPWLASTLTTDRLRELLPEAAGLPVHRYLLPNLRAVNFVIEGLLGQGVAAAARFDPQAKGLGEWLRARCLEVPEDLL
ncbi:MAG TPA: acyclic terpene utilization AtuA family protein [Streptosporangiaceae bacterium]|nr:acyclic terpene utilization AtuA family protein [Streptosporangiaceae bacterium]